MKLNDVDYDEHTFEQGLLLNIKEGVSDDIRNKCLEYWDLRVNSKNKVIYSITVAELSRKYNTKQETLREKVQENSFVFDTNEKCDECGNYLIDGIKRNRSMLQTHRVLSTGYGKCQDCFKKEQEKKQKELEEYNKKQEEEQNQLYEKEVLKHIEAIDNGVYESLTPIELNYLIHLAKTKDSNKVAKIMGISEKKRESLHKKMGKLYLITFPPSGGYHMNPDFEKALCKLNTNDKLKPVFGSKAAHDLYKKLRRTYLYVYPEVSLAAFIKKQDVEHLFTESWHYDYFLMCRLDFLVTDQYGMPRFGVEYQGGYHENTEQKVKDEFKLKLMNELGLEIQYKTHLDLKDD